MSINTINATIQMRSGLESDFDPDKLTTGEWAVSTDEKYVRMCFAPGIVLRMATYEAFEQDMQEIQTILATCQEIQVAVERFEQLAQQHTSQSEEWTVLSKSWAVGGTNTREGEDVNNSEFWSNQSKAEADRAKNEADRAASIAGFDIDSELSTTSTNPVENRVITNALNNIDVDISSEPIEFLESTERINIESGETIPLIFGKISKWFADLKAAAFYNVVNSATQSEPGQAVLDAAVGKYLDEKKIDISKIVKNTVITEEGFLMDGKTASEALGEINKELNADQYNTKNSKGKFIGMYNGKKLYEVSASGSMANFVSSSSLQEINVRHNVPNVGSIVGVISARYGNWDNPYLQSGQIQTCIGQVTNTVISFRNMAAWGSNYTWRVTFRYTLA